MVYHAMAKKSLQILRHFFKIIDGHGWLFIFIFSVGFLGHFSLAIQNGRLL